MSHLNRANYHKNQLTYTSFLLLNLSLPFLVSTKCVPVHLMKERSQGGEEKVSFIHMVLFVFRWHRYSHTVTNINF